MKRKLSFTLRPLKITTVAQDLAPSDDSATSSPDMDALETSSVSSLDFNPPSPYIDRRPLTPSTEISLRQACCLVLDAHDPSVDVSLILQKHNVTNVDRYGIFVERSNSTAADRSAYLRRPSVTSESAHGSTAMRYVPRNAANSFRETTGSRAQSVNRGRSASCGQSNSSHVLPDRPSTAGPAGPAGLAHDLAASSSSTTTSTTWAASARHSKSTAPTTLASNSQTPAEYQDVEGQIAADARARTWMAEENARRRRDQDQRPISRGRSIVEYIRPRSSSRGSTRSVYSHDTDNPSSSWWRAGSLRRPRSSRSLRVAPEPFDMPVLPSPELDLNRALPPLPSLATYDAQATTSDAKFSAGGIRLTHVVTTRTVDEPRRRRDHAGPPPDRRERRRDGERSDRKADLGPARAGRSDRERRSHTSRRPTGSGLDAPPREPAKPTAAESATKMDRLKRQLSRFTLGSLRHKPSEHLLAQTSQPQQAVAAR